MSFASRYNKGNRFDVDTTGFDYRKLSDLKDGQVYKLCGVYVNHKSAYGPAPVAILEDCFVNLPAHVLNDVMDMLTDPEVVSDIKAGKCGFSRREYVDGKGVKRYSVSWEDCIE